MGIILDRRDTDPYGGWQPTMSRKPLFPSVGCGRRMLHPCFSLVYLQFWFLFQVSFFQSLLSSLLTADLLGAAGEVVGAGPKLTVLLDWHNCTNPLANALNLRSLLFTHSVPQKSRSCAHIVPTLWLLSSFVVFLLSGIRTYNKQREATKWPLP